MNLKEYESRIKSLSIIELKKEQRYLRDNIIFSSSMLEKFPSKHWQDSIDMNREKLESVNIFLAKKNI